MWLAQLRADNFRLLNPTSLRPHRRLNLIIGPNAAGKTSLLETIYCLGRGKSFRGNSPAELAGPKTRDWSVGGRIGRDGSPAEEIAVSWKAGGTTLALGAKPVVTLDLVRALPVQILEPGMHRLLQDGPSYRRSFLDWGVFHVEQDFYPTWRRFHRALRQRNHALRSGATPASIRAWHEDMAAAATRIDEFRRAHIGAIRQRFGELVATLLGITEWSLELYSGWSRDHSYRSVLDDQIDRDVRMGTTVEGPQRAELRIRLDAHSTRNRISRGQQKLLIAALLVSQSEFIGASTAAVPLLLIDDFTAELAEPFQRRFVGVLASYPGQLWISSFELGGALAAQHDAAVFHVEHGRCSAA